MLRLSLSLSFIFLSVLPQSSHANILIEREAGELVSIRRDKGKVLYLACQLSLEGQISLVPEKLISQCGAAKKNTYEVPESQYLSSLNALIGIPTHVLPEDKTLAALTEQALNLETLYRQTDPDAQKVEDYESIFEKLQFAEEAVLQYLAPDHHVLIRKHETEDQEKTAYLAITSLTPVFSDGHLILALGWIKPLAQSYDSCREGWAMASLKTIVDLVSSPRASAGFQEWVARTISRAYPNQRVAPNVAAWANWVESVPKDALMVNTRKHEYFKVSLTPENVKYAQDHSLHFGESDFTISPLERPGNGKLFTLIPKQNLNSAMPLLCVRRYQPFQKPRSYEGGSITLESLARRYATDPKEILRLALSSDDGERVLWPLLTANSPLPETVFNDSLKLRLDEAYGVNVPTMNANYRPPPAPKPQVVYPPPAQPAFMPKPASPTIQKPYWPPVFGMSKTDIDTGRLLILQIILEGKYQGPGKIAADAIANILEEAEYQLRGQHRFTRIEILADLKKLKEVSRPLIPESSPSMKSIDALISVLE